MAQRRDVSFRSWRIAVRQLSDLDDAVCRQSSQTAQRILTASRRRRALTRISGRLHLESGTRYSELIAVQAYDQPPVLVEVIHAPPPTSLFACPLGVPPADSLPYWRLAIDGELGLLLFGCRREAALCSW